MTVRYFCPIEPCGWYHDEADLELPVHVPWKRIPGDSLARLTQSSLTAEQIVFAHLEHHPRLDFVQEISRLGVQVEMMQIRAERANRRAEAAEAYSEALESAVKTAADFTSAMDAITTLRMPTRAEYEDVKAGFLALAEPAATQPEEYAS